MIAYMDSKGNISSFAEIPKSQMLKNSISPLKKEIFRIFSLCIYITEYQILLQSKKCRPTVTLKIFLFQRYG